MNKEKYLNWFVIGFGMGITIGLAFVFVPVYIWDKPSERDLLKCEANYEKIYESYSSLVYLCKQQRSQ